MGGDNVIGVKVDSRGKMDIGQLKLEIKSAIEQGKEPFLIAATAGSTYSYFHGRKNDP
jgi:hypothetical protein